MAQKQASFLEAPSTGPGYHYPFSYCIMERSTGSGRGGAGPAKVAGGTWGFGSAAGYQKLQTEVLYHFHSVSAPEHPRDCQCCLEAQGLMSLPHGVPSPTGFWGSKPHG